ncbi:DUF2501 domain-containing protein [Salinisphaera sp. SPP-AMP-43]|uniref:DUF2501 domain-containing protein n=1 Tax=Salinisphaera sp. SPP-AMP-43 TaxID=3121288 RepID=UPI003C6E4CC2
MTFRSLAATTALAAALVSSAAGASGFDDLKQSAGQALNSQSQTSNQKPSGPTALLTQMSTGSLSLGNMQNAAGVLGYCQKQGYAASASEQVKNKLLSRLGGPQQAEHSSSYEQGLKGLLSSNSGQTFSLAGVKEQIGQRICSAVANRAVSSFLGS